MTMHDDSQLDVVERDLQRLAEPRDEDERIRRAVRKQLAAGPLTGRGGGYQGGSRLERRPSQPRPRRLPSSPISARPDPADRPLRTRRSSITR